MSLADRYQWLFRKSPALTVSLDEEGFFLDASDAWLKRFGYSREDLKQKRPQDLGSPESARRVNEEYLPLEINVHDIQEIWQVNSKLTFNLDNPSNSGLFQELQQSMEELKKELKSFKK